ncbi:MAG: hypothetical protein GH158_01815 [Dehalococcoidia bacterium]|nr:hypothetical protein [Dehalococcoidia bacterium]
MANKKRRKEEEHDVITIHRSFSSNLEGLDTFVGNLGPIVEKHDTRAIRKIERGVRDITKVLGIRRGKNGKVIEDKGERKISQEQLDRVVEMASGLVGINLAQARLLYNSAFVMLISYFDFLISDLIHCFYRKYPESLTGKELSITLNELKSLENVEEAINHIVSKEVERILYENFDKQKNYLNSFMKIDTQDELLQWNVIQEGIERRNIVVHNDSKINRRYLSSVDLSIVPEKKKELKIGEKIGISDDYFRKTWEEIYIAGSILIQNCWRKWMKEDIGGADRALNSDIYDALVKERWVLAERLGLFSKGCKVSSQQTRLYFDINYCQSLKWQGKTEELNKELEKIDVSTLSPIYLLAIYALRSDKENFYRGIEKAVIIDELKESDLMLWPLFKEFRKDQEYEERVKSIFRLIQNKSRKNVEE